MAKTPPKIDKYEIISKIAEGGMGVVYRAQHPTLKRPVILKRLTLRGKKGIVERFRREARLMMDFRNDHIVDVYDHFKDGNSYYIVEEFVDGVSLDKLIRKDRYLSNEAALLIFFEACKALKYAHDKGVVHRDIKPGNILISKEGEVKLTDFGIAREQDDEEADTGLTTAGMTLGTVAYMSPEQIHSSRDVDRRADIYSMGVMLYEMICGKLPYPGSFTPETLNLIQKGRHKAVYKINPKTAPIVRRIIRRSMRPSPKRRYQDVGDLLRVLHRGLRKLEEPEIKATIKAYIDGKKLSRVCRRGGGLIPAAFPALAILLVAGGVGYGYREGYYHEYLGFRRFGAVTVTVDRVTGAEVTIAPEPRETDQVDGGEVVSQILPMRVGPDGRLTSRRVYLPVGTYNVVVGADGLLHTRRFLLRPRETQRALSATADGRRIDVRLGKAPQLPVTLEPFVYDRATGIDLTRKTRISFHDGTRWLAWNRLNTGRFVSGREYRLKLETDGYLEAQVTVAPAPHQSSVTVSVAMAPQPGTISIGADKPGVRLEINGSAYYLSGDENPTYIKLSSTGDEPRQVTLSPGTYQLTAEKGGLSRSATISVRSGLTQHVTVQVGSDAITINTGT